MGRIVVVGAGPAGAAVAIQLRRLGHDVTLIDRATFPRRKSCGEGLFSPGVRALEELGVLPALLPQACVLESLRMEIDGRGAEAPLSPPGAMALGVRRELLDHCLVQRAAEEGVELRFATTATGLLRSNGRFDAVQTRGGPIYGDVIVLADGLRSGLRRAAGLEGAATGNRYGVSAHYLLPRKPLPKVHIRLQQGSEVYVTPVGGDLVNIALLLDKGSARQLGGRLTEAFETLVDGSGVLPAGSKLVDEPLAGGPFPASARRSYRDNLLLAGDAGGFFDGISGEGMSLALVSARDAALAADRFLVDGDSRHFRSYEKERRRLARNSTLLARINLFLAAHPVVGRRIIGNLGRRPQTFGKVLALNQGSLSLSAIRPRDLVATLFGI
jgi:flavin-dependent dehydrogenase